MIQIQDVIVSFDVLTKCFCCALDSCKGACCIEGDAGAPVTLEEIAAIEEILPIVWEDLSVEARKIINRQGVAYPDPDGEMVTSIVNGRDCVFTCYGEDGCCYCALEKAYRAGRTKFAKPVSCALYPIREKKIGNCTGLNYDRWDVCRAAALKGEREGIPVYKFLSGPLIRRFGQAWYDELELTVNELKRQGII